MTNLTLLHVKVNFHAVANWNFVSLFTGENFNLFLTFSLMFFHCIGNFTDQSLVDFKNVKLNKYIFVSWTGSLFDRLLTY